MRILRWKFDCNCFALLVKYFSQLFGEILFWKAFGKHSVLPLMKEKCEENVLETMTFLLADALERERVWYIATPFSSLNIELFSGIFVQGMAMLGLRRIFSWREMKMYKLKKWIIFLFSLVKYYLLILILVFTDVLLESESFFPPRCSYISCYLLVFVDHI